jgi:hypothetical protein
MHDPKRNFAIAIAPFWAVPIFYLLLKLTGLLPDDITGHLFIGAESAPTWLAPIILGAIITTIGGVLLPATAPNASFALLGFLSPFPLLLLSFRAFLTEPSVLFREPSTLIFLGVCLLCGIALAVVAYKCRPVIST